MKNAIQPVHIMLGAGLMLGVMPALRAQVATDKGEWVAPVANPILFESPVVSGEVHPFFFYHNLNNDFPTRGGHVEVYGIQARAALTDRLAVLLTKAGYMILDPNSNPSNLQHDSGWANLTLGVKYAFIEHTEAQFVVTPGLKFELPVGEDSVWQGEGKGIWNPFVSAAKGFGSLQIMGNLGLQLPMDTDAQTSQLHYGLQVAYAINRWFKPFVAFNGYVVLSGANDYVGTWRGNLDTEGYDLFNFGSSEANNRHQIVFGTGWRTQLLSNLDFGFAWEKGITDSDGMFDDRFTVDLLFRF